jgi:hypothetical protein
MDLLAAAFAANGGWAHMDIDPDQTTPHGPNLPPGPWFNPNIPCKPGIDYLRSTKDKHVSEVALMVDRSQQRNGIFVDDALGLAALMHGASGRSSKKGWKNELFGDGHCESRRLDQMREHWSANNPEAW